MLTNASTLSASKVPCASFTPDRIDSFAEKRPVANSGTTKVYRLSTAQAISSHRLVNTMLE